MAKRLSLLCVVVVLLLTAVGDGEAQGPRQPYAGGSGTYQPGSQRHSLGSHGRSSIERCALIATIDLQSQTQKRSYSGYVYEAVDRFVHNREGLWSHLISARVSVKNVPEEPITFIFKWFDPDGGLAQRTEHVRPDRGSLLFRPGHWTLYPIVGELEMKDRPLGKYTFVVEYPEGTVIAERSFNYYAIDGGTGVVARYRRTILLLVFGVVFASLGVVMVRVLR